MTINSIIMEYISESQHINFIIIILVIWEPIEAKIMIGANPSNSWTPKLYSMSSKSMKTNWSSALPLNHSLPLLPFRKNNKLLFLKYKLFPGSPKSKNLLPLNPTIIGSAQTLIYLNLFTTSWTKWIICSFKDTPIDTSSTTNKYLIQNSYPMFSLLWNSKQVRILSFPKINLGWWPIFRNNFHNYSPTKR